MKRLLPVMIVAVTIPATAQLIGFGPQPCFTGSLTSGLSPCASETTSSSINVQAILQTAKLAATYIQQGLILDKTNSIFSLANTMAKYIPGTSGMWPSAHVPWTPVYSPDTFGVNGGWQTVNNVGAVGGISSALSNISTPLGIGKIPGIPPQFQGAVQQGIAAIERHDGLIQGSISVIGQYMLSSPALTQRLKQLAFSMTSDDASELTYAAQMQKQGAAIMLGTQSQQMGVEVAQRQLLDQEALMILQRQAAANEVNAALYTYSTATANLTMTTATSDALHALKIP